MTEPVTGAEPLERWGRNNPPHSAPEWMRMEDGYWTPWHMAQAELDRLRGELLSTEIRRSNAARGYLEKARDLDALRTEHARLRAELALYKPTARVETGGTT